MMFGWVIVLGLIGWGIYALVKHSSPASTGRRPVEVARERYARGEITRDEFERIKKDIA